MANQNDIRSRFVLKFEQEGVEKVQKHVDKLRQSMQGTGAAGAMGGAAGSAGGAAQGRLVRQIAGFSRHMKDASKALIEMTKAANRAAGALNRAGGRMGPPGPTPGGPADVPPGGGGGGGGPPDGRGRPGGPDDPRRGSFTQGVLQGAGFGPYLQRGPGMFRQAAGMSVGRAAGGMARGAAAMPFRGLGGLAEGLGSLPGGGLVGSALETAVGTAESQLGFQQALLGFGGLDSASRRSRAGRARLMQQATAQARTRAAAANEAAAARAREASPIDFELRGMQTRTGGVAMGMDDFEVQRVEENIRRGSASRTESMVAEARARAQTQARRRFGNDPMSAFRRSTRDLTVFDQTQALQFAQQAGLSGIDGSFAAAQRGGGLRSALAAQTIGVGDAGTLGGFLRGQRRGGIVGAEAPGAGIAETIEGAFAAGFDRSEAVQLLQSINQGQQQFIQSGIPINPQSILSISRGVTGAFGAGARSAAVAQGVTRAAGQVSERGPRSAEEFLLLRTLGGFRGGGLEGLEEAQARLEGGQFGQDQLFDFIRRASGAAGGGAAGRFAVRGGLQQLGIRTGVGEIRKLQSLAFADPSTLSGKDQDFIDRELGRLGQGPRDAQEALDRRARGQIGQVGGLVGRRNLEDTRIGVGAQILPAVQKFENVTLTAARAVGNLGPALSSLAGGAQTIADYLPRITEWLQGNFGGGNSPPNLNGN